MTRKELAEQVNLAYDQYLTKSKSSGPTPVSCRRRRAWCRTIPARRSAPRALWAEFQAEQTRLNQEYSDAIEAKHKNA